MRFAFIKFPFLLLLRTTLMTGRTQDLQPKKLSGISFIRAWGRCQHGPYLIWCPFLSIVSEAESRRERPQRGTSNQREGATSPEGGSHQPGGSHKPAGSKLKLFDSLCTTLIAELMRTLCGSSQCVMRYTQCPPHFCLQCDGE